MTLPCIGVKGTGVVCALGLNVESAFTALVEGRSGLRPLTRFNPPHAPLPVGEIALDPTTDKLPPTHVMARQAADQAMAQCDRAPDAVVIGSTTGGIAVTEELLKSGCHSPEAYHYHAIGSVADDLAQRYHCTGPVLTVSTACSSGAAAIALAMAMLRSGACQRVLAGGVDSLCRLTYYGFKSLQLIDPLGSRPMDKERRGMSVAEGAGMLLLEANPGDDATIYMLGAGLSCDAHHPAQPHPQGKGALAAMQAALADAGLNPVQIDYINLHGTGTSDNDRAEARAIHALFESQMPPLSSIKGATGHSLAASGAIEAVIAAQIIEKGLVPANTGCRQPDPELELHPVVQPVNKQIGTVLSNSFGFGGNNATLVVGSRPVQVISPPEKAPLAILGWAAVTGAGTTSATMDHLERGLQCQGQLGSNHLSQGLPPQMIRRLKRLPLMSLSLATAARTTAGDSAPNAVFFGTGWGALSETHDFLKGLYDSEEKFPSPIDFIGSVHNAPAGQLALLTGATGPNITVSGGDSSFEQALMSAQLLAGNEPLMVLAADEGHPKLSPLFDPSVAKTETLSDGGGLLMLQRNAQPKGERPQVALKHFETIIPPQFDPGAMISALGGSAQIKQRYKMILVGIPASKRSQGETQLAQFLDATGYNGPLLDYRPLIGEFASASAVATVFAASQVQGNAGPKAAGRAMLVMGLGTTVTAIDVGLS